MLASVAIWLCYATLIGWSIRSLRRIQPCHITFMDGALVGAAFYLALPLGVMLMTGSFSNSTLDTGPYLPFEHVATTFNLFMGWATILSLHGFTSRRVEIMPPRDTDLIQERFALYVFAALLAALSVASFFLAQKHLGGHWQGNLAHRFSESTTLIITKNFANAYRAMIFGFLVYAARFRLLSRRAAIVFGVVVVVFDLALTFNRITAAYFAIFLCLLLYRRIWLVAGATLVAAPLLSFWSAAWTTFRGMALSEGMNANSFSKAVFVAIRYQQLDGGGVSTTLNSIFEASNILVFNYIVRNTPEKLPILWGETYIVRPLTVFIPSTFWPNKPVTFGVQLGNIIELLPGLALNSTLFGEAFGNFYYIWPIALGATLLLLHFIFSHLSRRARFYSFFGFFVAFAMWRFDMSFSAIAIVAVVTFESYRTISRKLLHTRVRRARSVGYR